MNIETGYINATHLCGLVINEKGNKKELFHWKRSETAKELIREASSSLHIRMDDLFVVVSGGQVVEIRGTYIHPKLISHIASWASHKFAIKASRQ